MENRNTMKKLKKIGYPALIFLLTSLSFTSCSDEWDAHYSLENTGKIDSNIFDYIKSRSDLSLFRAMILNTGYDSILSQSKAYTVWAPTDSSLVDNPILLDTASWKNLVGNHIASWAHPVSQADSQTITMLNGKRLMYNFMDATASMDGVTVIEKDRATKNGLVQVMSGILPYRYNQWENIFQQPGIDSLRNYVLSLNRKVLDNNRSYDNGVFIDSFFITTNQILNSLGNFNLEDSIYTSILPNNAAWIDAYNRISPYYKTKAIDGGAVAQRTNTLWSIVRDLFFWGRIDVPTNKAKLVSTNWTTLKNPDSLFLNAQKKVLSNGYAYTTSKLQQKAADSWCKEIRVEAENAFSGRIPANYTVTTNSSLGTKFNVSNNAYVYCNPTSTSALSPLTMTFPIPNTLSTKYNIYVVFIPSVITDTTDKRPYKVDFYMSNNINLATNVNGPQPTFGAKMNATSIVTDPLNVTKVLVAKNYEFTTANITNGGYLIRSLIPQGLSSPTTVGLKIRNVGGTSATEIKNFNRAMCIDCVILEPVQ